MWGYIDCSPSPSIWREATYLKHFSFFSSSLINCKMDGIKGKGKKNMMVGAWKRCQSICRRSKKCMPNISPCSSVSNPEAAKPSKTPKGYFPVYVGAQKQRFLIKTQFTNHPLFMTLLEEAELEYGYSNGGPVSLPCHVDTFYEVLAEMDGGRDEISRPGSSFLSPSHSLGLGDMAKGYGHYSLLISPSRMLEVN